MARNKETFVTVETVDGDVFVGTLVEVDSHTLSVETGLAGRPVVLDKNEVAEVLPVSAKNPHVEFVTRKVRVPHHVKKAHKVVRVPKSLIEH